MGETKLLHRVYTLNEKFNRLSNWFRQKSVTAFFFQICIDLKEVSNAKKTFKLCHLIIFLNRS